MVGNVGLGAMIGTKFETLADAQIDLGFNEGIIALVYADPDPSNNDLLVKESAAGEGSWQLTTILHDVITGAGIPALDAKVQEAQGYVDAAQQVIDEAVANAAEVPVIRAAITTSIDEHAITAARAAIYGVTIDANQRLFTSESIELAIAESYHRSGFAALSSIEDVVGWAYTRTAIASAKTATSEVHFFAENAPRVTDQGLLVEGPGNNKFLWTEDFTNAVWVKNLAHVVSNVAPGPRGEGTMDKIVATGTGVHNVQQAVTNVSTASFYAKAAELGWCAIEFHTSTSFLIAYFDLVNGVVGNVSAGVTARIDPAARGSWRISATIATANATISVYAATGNGGASFGADAPPYSATAGFYLDMAQAEPNARPFSYIPVSDTAATRSADQPSMGFAPTGDFTLYVEADVPAPRATDDGLLSLVADDPTNRVAIYRNSGGNIAVEVSDADGVKVVAGPYYADAQTIRAAISVTSTSVRASFDGGEPVALAANRPNGLNKLWLGLIADTLGFELNGFVRTVVTRSRASTDAELQAFTNGENSMKIDVATTADLQQALAAHSNDRTPHDLTDTRLIADLADSKTGIWTLAAADTFTGANGHLTMVETGSQPWLAVGGNPMSRIGGVCKSEDGTLRGTYVAGLASDGQVEADLTPNSGEASLYFRWFQNGDYLMLQRGGDHSIGLKVFVAGASSNLSPVRYIKIEAGERFKVRFVGSRIWVFRIVGGKETLIFDVTSTQWQTASAAGIRTNADGAVDNFKVFSRESL